MTKYHVTTSELSWRTFEVEAEDANEAEALIMEHTNMLSEPSGSVKAVNSGETDFQITDVWEVEA